MAAFSASPTNAASLTGATELTGALSSLEASLGSLDWSNARKLLATSSYVMVGFGSFLNFTMFVSISGAQQQRALPAFTAPGLAQVRHSKNFKAAACLSPAHSLEQ